MGGEHSGVTEATTDILIECAYFDPEHIALTGQKLGLASDARSRFERGVDPAFLETGLAARHRDWRSSWPAASPRRSSAPGRRRSRTRSSTTTRRAAQGSAGVDVPEDRQQDILAAARLHRDRGDVWRVAVPSWRRDVDGAADIVEEVVRIDGLDQVPSTPLPRAPGVARPTATPEQLVERRARRDRGGARAQRGGDLELHRRRARRRRSAARPGVLANPISEEMKAMRPVAAARPARRGARATSRAARRSIRLFEIGRRYLAEAERPTLGLVLAGPRGPRHWARQGRRASTPIDAKAEALAILAAAGAPVDNLQVLGDASARLPSRPVGAALPRARRPCSPSSARSIRASPRRSTSTGRWSRPRSSSTRSRQKRGAAGHMRSAYAPPPLQAVTRDFAFLVPAELPAGELLRAVRGADKAAIAAARLFDVFTGQGVPEGQKSLAIEVTLQPGEKSFTDEELKAISERIVAAAAKLGATLRA